MLAGGDATRFGGGDKAALIVDGRTILDRQIDVLQQVADDVLIVGGARRGHIPGVRQVDDHLAGRGPLGGVHTALIEARHPASIVVACDMPFLAAPFLQRLLMLAADADVVVPRTERGYHPLCAAYTRACLEPIARRLEHGRLKMIGLFDDVRVRVVSAEELAAFGDPERVLANVNTPADYRSIGANQL